MTEERPRPQYGEYASPEEQAKAANRNLPQRRTVGPPLPPREPPPPVTAATAPPGLYSSARHPVDRGVTIFLLALGAFSLINSIPGYVAFSSMLSTLYAQFGAPVFPAPELANSVGIGLLVLHVLLFAGTVVLSVRRMRRGAWAFFVPLIGFVAYILVFTAGMFILASAQPEWFNTVLNSIRGTL